MTVHDKSPLPPGEGQGEGSNLSASTLLTDNLPLLAGAPSGIKKLRELILELAVVAKNATTKSFLALRIMGNVQNPHLAYASRITLAQEARP